MTENTLNNGQFRIDPFNILLALLASLAVAQLLPDGQAAAMAAVFPHMILAVNHVRR